jgi:hypothetical protein
MTALERKIVDSKMKEMGEPMNVIRDIVANNKHSASSLKRMMQYILMKHPNSSTRKAKKPVIKPVGGTAPKPEKPEKVKNTKTRRGFLQRLLD